MLSQSFRRRSESGKISVLMIVLISIACVVVVGLLLLGLGGWFLYEKAKEAGLDTELLSENPAVAVARMAAAMNPNIEVVSVDENAGQITILDKESGKKVTLNLEDVAQGKISFETDDGKTSTLEVTENEGQGTVRLQSSEGTAEFGQTSVKLPDWIPLYPGATVQGGMSGQTAEGLSGQASIATPDSPEKVIEFYTEALKKAGLEVNTIQHGGADGIDAMINAVGADQGRQVVLMIGKSEQGTTGSVAFSERN